MSIALTVNASNTVEGVTREGRPLTCTLAKGTITCYVNDASRASAPCLPLIKYGNYDVFKVFGVKVENEYAGNQWSQSVVHIYSDEKVSRRRWTGKDKQRKRTYDGKPTRIFDTNTYWFASRQAAETFKTGLQNLIDQKRRRRRLTNQALIDRLIRCEQS